MMLTREEQIMMLEEAFNRLVSQNHDAVMDEDSGDYEFCNVISQQLQAVSIALTYLRTAIPNPYGKIDPMKSSRRIRLDL
jgi:hypothetical protein